MIRILIVDDQKNAREYVKSILEEEPNFEVVGLACDGHEAIRLAKNLEPDIILMDIEMPRFNGLAASLIISQQNPNATIIILSSHNLDSLLDKILDAGATGYIIKGADPEKITNTISLIYQGNQIVQQKPNTSDNIISDEYRSHHQPHMMTSTTTVKSSKLYSNESLPATRDDFPILSQSELHQLQPDFFSSEPSNKLNLITLKSVLKRRYPYALMAFAGVLIGAILYLIFTPKTYKATASMILQNHQGSISELGKDLSNIATSNEYSSLSTQAKIIESKSVLSSAIRSVMEKQGSLPESISPSSVQNDLSIEVVPNTNILEVSYVNKSPELASQLLSEIINVVIARNSNSIRSEAKSVRQFLENKVNQQKKELSRIETSENLYRKEKGIVALDAQTTRLVDNLSNLEAQEQDLSTQIEEQEAKFNNFKQIAKVDNAQSAYATGTVSQDKQLEKIRAQLTDVNSELAAARSNFTESNPVIISLLEKREKLSNLYEQQVGNVLGGGSNLSTSSPALSNQTNQAERGLGQEVLSGLILVQNQLEANKNKLQAIKVEKSKIKDRIASLPAVAQSLTELVRQREQADENLQFLQRKLEEARIAEAQLVSNIEVSEGADTDSSPNSPKIPLVLATASIVGTILAASIVLLLEKVDRTLYDAQQVERQLQIPLLSSLPHLKYNTGNFSQIKSFLNNQDLYEPYRSLLKRLEASSPRKLKTIVISSAVEGEGKSTVVSNLGAMSAVLSKRTLIIDAHINRPTQSSLFDIKPLRGLTEVIRENLSLDRAVVATKIEHLFVLPAGILTSNSCAILESPAMKALVQEAEVKYDLVIIDAPPVDSSCDAQTLSKYSNGLIIVTRPLHTNTDILEKTVEELRINRAPIFGFVVNHGDEQKYNSTDDSEDEYKDLSLLLDMGQTESRQNSEEMSKL